MLKSIEQLTEDSCSHCNERPLEGVLCHTNNKINLRYEVKSIRYKETPAYHRIDRIEFHKKMALHTTIISVPEIVQTE